MKMPKIQKIFSYRIKWLEKKMPKINPAEWYLMGSSIFIPSKAKDVDIVIFYNQESKVQIQSVLQTLKMDFELQVWLQATHNNISFKREK